MPIVKISKKYFRPAEVEMLVGDASKARKKLGWKIKYTFDTLVKEMIENDLMLVRKDMYLKEHGFKIIGNNE